MRLRRKTCYNNNNNIKINSMGLPKKKREHFIFGKQNNSKFEKSHAQYLLKHNLCKIDNYYSTKHFGNCFNIINN